ncbi:hypothetical protein BTM25_50590 [Actinomadura rubteroloni]|uniref:Uncharacterized protein n=1 Tax=Actinomadura rubteroloni TaxID=1926885 RepID=A0A2P4UCS7_9ACTN|nr:hypothetical protein [Actinomadura rubteroloni]POM22853.1 hypothetical protein BTM25_50590 [Actinomadura rubteroloni]
MPGKLPELSTTQLIASGLATMGAAVGASYLGVYGTIIGAAFMSVASTAGGIVAKHYLDRGKEQIKERAHLVSAVLARDEAERAAAAVTSADPARAAPWAARTGLDPNATLLDPSALDPGATRRDVPLPPGGGPGGDPGATRLDGPAAVAGALADAAGEDALRRASWRAALVDTRDWTRRHWMKLAASSAVVFALVIGGITLWEVAAGGIGKDGGRGPTVVRVFGGGEARKPSHTPTHQPSGKPTGTPTPTAPTSPTPTTKPETTPSPTPGTTTPTTPAPTTTRPSTAPSTSQPAGGAETPRGIERTTP